MKSKGLKRAIRYILISVTALLLILVVINSIPVIMKMIYPLKYKEYVTKYCTEYNIDDPYLVYSIIKAESSFNSKAVSRKDARGLMQITKSTGKWAADIIGMEGYTFESLHDPETNIHIGCWYINWLKDYFLSSKGYVDNDLIIAAYNSGSGNVNAWLKDKSLSMDGHSLNSIPFKETARFQKKVKNYLLIYKRLYEK